MDKQKLTERRANLIAERDKRTHEVVMLNGAIADTDWWLAEIERNEAALAKAKPALDPADYYDDDGAPVTDEAVDADGQLGVGA